MKLYYIIPLALSIVLFVIFLLINSRKNKINKIEEKIIELFFWKLNKIPALVEIVRYEIPKDWAYKDIIMLHTNALIWKFEDFYDVLEINAKLNREFQFFMNISIRQWNLARDWNFIYLRDFIIFFEKEINKEINKIRIEIEKYNKLVSLKNLTIIWLLFPISKKIEI